MVYHAIGLMSGSSLDGVDLCFAQFDESAGKWGYKIECAACIDYDIEWEDKLRDAISLSAQEYQLLHTDYGHFLGALINHFINDFHLEHKVNLISSHGHTTFHDPARKMTHQLGDGAAIAAETQLPVVSDLRSMDIAFGGQGAPIVPLGEKLLFPECDYFLNIGGITNITFNENDRIVAYDICAANRVLNMLAVEKGLSYDKDGEFAFAGRINEDLLEKLNRLDYYSAPYPKSLANSFGTDVIYPLIKSFGLSTEDSLCTYTEHISMQVSNSLQPHFSNSETHRLMITGGGAFNTFLIKRISKRLSEINFEVYVPDKDVVIYKEALIMALLGVLRWREQDTVLSSVTGASRDSIGGALWLGTEA